MNKNRKLVAFAERGDRPHVVVFDLELRRRRKVLRCAEFVSQEVISLAFSHDSKYLLAQGNLSRGIDNCFGAARSVVWGTTFSDMDADIRRFVGSL